MSIPVVDFSVYNLSKKDAPDGELQALSEELKEAFLQVGFVFLENSGISQEEVERVFDVSRKFFLQPEDLKKPFSRGSFPNNPNYGWVSMENERNGHRQMLFRVSNRSRHPSSSAVKS